jgi:hypothetical protein
MTAGQLTDIKLFSLWQPWASFMELGYKRNETRSWSTAYRGLIAIHAAKTKKALLDADDILERAGFDMSEHITTGGRNLWPLGKIVCVVRLVDCVKTEAVRDSLTRQERAMGDYSDGRFAWMTTDLLSLEPGIPFRGVQGLKPLSPEGVKAIRERLPKLVV